MKITAIVSLHEKLNMSPESQPRRLEAVDEFVAELSRACNVKIPVLEGSLDLAPPDGIVLVFDATGLRERPDVAKRTVLINADRAFVKNILEDCSLVAAVEKQRYFRWRTNRSAERGEGVFGQKRVAEKIQASATPGPFTTERYILLKDDQLSTLVALLGKYLSAYTASEPLGA